MRDMFLLDTAKRFYTVTMRNISIPKSKFVKMLIWASVMCLALIIFKHISTQRRETILLRGERCKLAQTFGLQPSDIKLNRTDWSFKKPVQCPELNISNYPPTRKSIFLQCTCKNNKSCINQKDSEDSSIFEIPFGDTCLIDAIDLCCKDNFLVPNIVHYVWFGNIPMTFFHLLSFMSAVNFIKPCMILIHGPDLPHGVYWDFFLRVYSNVIHVKRSRPTAVAGNKLAFKEHGSDVMRIEALQGGYGCCYFVRLKVILLFCQPRVTVTLCFVYKVIRDQ